MMRADPCSGRVGETIRFLVTARASPQSGSAKPLLPPAPGWPKAVGLALIPDPGRIATLIDEVRYAGQTQSITVQPKGGARAYEVQPGSGQRVWNVLNF